VLNKILNILKSKPVMISATAIAAVSILASVIASKPIQVMLDDPSDD
jgi:hypothetical protein